MRAVRFKVSDDLLRDILHMPPTSQIVGAEMCPYSVSFTVVDPELPDTDTPAEVTPSITAVHQIRRDGLPREFVWDWGITT